MTNRADLCAEAAKLQDILSFEANHPNRSKVFDELTKFYNYAARLAELKAKSKDDSGIKDMQRRYDQQLEILTSAINTSQQKSLF
jgi:hypothetical protein